MKKLKKILRNEFLLFLLGAVILDTVFMAVVFASYQGAPEVIIDSSLIEILEVFEGE